MKSYISTAFTIYEGIFKDATIRWPNLGTSLARDLSHLHRSVEERGFPFLTVTLPSLAKSFYKWLDEGTIDPQTIPQGVKTRNKRPEFLGGLWSMVFDDQGRLLEDACPDAVFFIHQVLVLCKKVRMECSPAKTEEALHEFFEIEAALPRSHPNTWDSQVPRWEPRTGHPILSDEECDPIQDQYALLPVRTLGISRKHWDDFRHYCRRIIGMYIGHYPEWGLRPKHGPGAVSEGARFGIKYDFAHWPSRLEAIFPYDWYGAGLLQQDRLPDDREFPSRLIAVPKTQSGPRLICAEPIAHQWMQQGISRWLESRLEATPLGRSFKLRDQTLSQKRALAASIDGSNCTIDLSAASDRISTRLVEYVFQGSNILDALHACRTRYMSQNISDKWFEFHLLRKFSTMGSACTFPVQGIIFLVLVSWALRLHDIISCAELQSDETYIQRTTVYGDDIIAPNTAIETIKLVLHECGLKVNSAKSFSGKHFRESCGMFAFKGIDISPAYYLVPYDGSPEALTATIEASNNLHIRGFWYGALYCMSQVSEQERKKLLVTDLGGSGGLGLKSFCGTSIAHLKVGYCKNYHRPFVRPLTVSSKSQRVRGQGTSSLSQFFWEQPTSSLWGGCEPLSQWSAGQERRPKLRKGLGRVYL